MADHEKYVIRFLREELNHVVMCMNITNDDVDLVSTLTTDELADWIYDKSMQVSYAKGHEDTLLYEWKMTGKEYMEGEGERGIFDFSLETWEKTELGETQTRCRPIGNEVPVTELDTQQSRLDRVENALNDYEEVRDLLTDLKHYCASNDIEFDVEEMIAHDNFEAERTEAANRVICK